MIQCVLFDLDGTLIDTWDLYIEAYIRTLEPYFGRRMTLDDLIALGPTSELRLLRRTPAVSDVASAYREFLCHYGSLHPTHFGGVYPGAREMLATLRTRGFHLGLVTGKSRGAWEITVKEVNLGEFEIVVTDEEVAKAKPEPEGLALALTCLGIPASDAVYVGDSVGDAKAGRAAGVRFAAALWPKAEDEMDGFLVDVRGVGLWAELSHPEGLVPILEESPD